MQHRIGSCGCSRRTVALLAIAMAPIVILASSCGTGPQASGASPTAPTTGGAPSAPTPPPVPTTPGPPQVSTPVNGAGVASPFQLSVTVPGQFNYMDVIADGTPIFHTSYPTIQNKWIFLPIGQHNLVFQTYDTNNQPLYQSSMQVNVTSETPNASITQIQTLSQFQSCTAHLFGAPCASGQGDAVFAMTQNQSNPSLSGNSTRFDLSGPVGYSNALWWNQLGGGTLLNHFTLALDFYISNGDVAEALEFDVNQSLNGTRYTYGTECSVLDTKQWNTWNAPTMSWVPTGIPCPPFASNTWHHLEWQFERLNGQVHYISVTVDGVTTPVNRFADPQPGYPYQGFDVAFQIDGNYIQTPYSVWVDNWTLTASY